MRSDVLAVAASAVLAAAVGCGADPARVAHDAATVCAELVADYDAAWPAAIACDAGVVGECTALRPEPIREDGALAGLGCDAEVNPAHVKDLDAILARFDAAGCKVLPLPCPMPLDLAQLPRRCTASGTCG